jgi:hypothetical protein
LNCGNFTSCDVNKYKYCIDDDIGLICKDGFIYGKIFFNLKFIDSNIATPNCTNTCSNEFFRGPENFKNGYICNLKCSANHDKCKNLNQSELNDINSNITCKSGYKRINYDCVAESTTNLSYMHYSGCHNSPNMIMDVNLKSYFISIWIRFNRANEFCSLTKSKRLYFVAYPHIIYSTLQNNSNLINEDKLFYYENIQTGARVNISNLVNFNWNLITMHYHEKTNTFKLIINNDSYNPAYMSSTAQITSYELRKILFCADNLKCKTILNDFNLNDDYIWGSAFYKDLKINDGIIHNYINFQEKEQFLNSSVIPIPDTLDVLYNLPLNSFNTNKGNLLDNSQLKRNLDATSNLNYRNSEYYKQLDLLFHFNSKLSVFDPNDNNYFSARDNSGGKNQIYF